MILASKAIGDRFQSRNAASQSGGMPDTSKEHWEEVPLNSPCPIPAK